MKRLPICLLAVIVLLSGCSEIRSWKREKITDPEQQHALQTRSAEVPIDSLFTEGAAKLVLSPFKRISFAKFRDDYKATYAVSEESLQREKYEKALIRGKAGEGKKLDEKAAKRKAAKAGKDVLSQYEIGTYDRLDWTIDNMPAADYSPGLTLLFGILLALFAVVFIIKVIFTFIVTPKR